METTSANWAASNWTLSNQANHTDGGTSGWKYNVNGSIGYDNGSPNSGYLTSPSIQLPASGGYYLRFYYQYETEDPGLMWDQRWVQLSVNGAPFNNLLQLSDEPKGYWLRSPAISLAQYAGQSIQIRFYFSTLDAALNQFSGWFIDDFSITTQPPPNCSDNDNSTAEATSISYGQSLNGQICPGGDIDYYRFQGVPGDQVGIRVLAKSLGSPLDTTLALIDTDGKSIIATNDDILQYELTDSFISYRILRAGNYFIRVKAWDHPDAGDINFGYTLTLSNDHDDPTASFLFPGEGSSLPATKVMLQVAARDTNSGIGLVRFYYHTDNWENSDWIYLGEDWDSSDGWNYEFDTSTISVRNGMAVFAVVYDWAGNWIGTGSWNLRPPMIYYPIILKSR